MINGAPRSVAGVPYEFSPLPASIAALMRGLGVGTIRNAGEIETIGLLIIVLASLLVAAVLVWVANLALYRAPASLLGKGQDDGR